MIIFLFSWIGELKKLVEQKSTIIIFHSKKMIIYILLSIATAIKAAGYAAGGSDWDETCIRSNLTRQSPIDLEDFKG